MNGKTTGAPIALTVENLDHAKWKGKAVEAMTVPRPGHADLAAALKYGYDDLRPGLERASARETAARMAACSVCRKFLAELGIRVGSYVVRIGAAAADVAAMPISERMERAEESPLRCPDLAADERMQAEIDRAMKAGDTLGGVFEVVALGVPPGLGGVCQLGSEDEFPVGSAQLFGIPAIKAVEFGDGLALAALSGTQAQDPIRREGDTIVRPSNHAGGIEAGITNGQPIVVRAAMKPIATTITPQESVDLAGGEKAETHYERSDYCAVPRAAVVGEGMVCLVLADAVMEKCGGDSLDEVRERFDRLPRGAVADFHLSPDPKIFWE